MFFNRCCNRVEWVVWRPPPPIFNCCRFSSQHYNNDGDDDDITNKTTIRVVVSSPVCASLFITSYNIRGGALMWGGKKRAEAVATDYAPPHRQKCFAFVCLYTRERRTSLLFTEEEKERAIMKTDGHVFCIHDPSSVVRRPCVVRGEHLHAHSIPPTVKKRRFEIFFLFFIFFLGRGVSLSVCVCVWCDDGSIIHLCTRRFISARAKMREGDWMPLPLTCRSASSS